ncbi:MAG: oxygenase MpaB family protein [Actinomycetota bacterium]
MIVGEALALIRREGGDRLRSMLAGDQEMAPAELAHRGDHGLFGPASSAWRVHGDSSMLIGGLRALMLQTLHPLAMAGVADHSAYREDPWGRLHRTGRFIGATTFGSTKTAEQTIAVVRKVHERVEGTAPDGRRYSASDPHLLAWVHITEVDSFLAAYDRYGEGRLTDAERDSYVAEMAEVGHRLGAVDLPTDRAQLAEALEAFRPECEYGEQARDTMRFLIRPPVPLVTRGPYALISAASIGLLPTWAQLMLRLPVPPGVDPLAIRPAATVLTRTVGWLMGGQRQDEIADRLLVETGTA